jgi:hypothetical protein
MNYPGEMVTINHVGFNMDNRVSTGGVAYLIWQGDARANFIHQVSGTVLDKTGFRLNNDVHHIRLQTMTIRNFTEHGINSGSSTSCTLKPSFIEVLNSEVRNNGDDSAGAYHEHGIYPTCGTSWLIDGNYFVGNFAYGIHVYSANSGWLTNFIVTRNMIEGRKGTSGTTAGILVTGGTGHLVANNLVIGRGRQANTLTVGIQVGSSAASAAIYNNTVYDVPTGIQVATVSGSIVQNNLLSAVTINIRDSGNNTKSGNLCNAVESGCWVVTATPNFQAPGSDFRLGGGSLAIDAGQTISSVKNDHDGSPRPAGNAYDIGAFEAGTSTTGPRPPTNLQVR